MRSVPRVSSKAFTIIELVIVVIILGIMAAIAGPQYTATLNRSYARDAVNNLNIIQATNTIYRVRNGGTAANNFACTPAGNWDTNAATAFPCRTQINAMNGADSLNITSTGGTLYYCTTASCFAQGRGGVFTTAGDGLFEARVNLAAGSGAATCTPVAGCP